MTHETLRYNNILSEIVSAVSVLRMGPADFRDDKVDKRYANAQDDRGLPGKGADDAVMPPSLLQTAAAMPSFRRTRPPPNAPTLELRYGWGRDGRPVPAARKWPVRKSISWGNGWLPSRPIGHLPRPPPDAPTLELWYTDGAEMGGLFKLSSHTRRPCHHKAARKHVNCEGNEWIGTHVDGEDYRSPLIRLT
jgi:hypothetical protein